MGLFVLLDFTLEEFDYNNNNNKLLEKRVREREKKNSKYFQEENLLSLNEFWYQILT